MLGLAALRLWGIAEIANKVKVIIDPLSLTTTLPYNLAIEGRLYEYYESYKVCVNTMVNHVVNTNPVPFTLPVRDLYISLPSMSVRDK